MSSPPDPTLQSRSSVDKSSEHDIEKVEHHGTKRISENDAIAKETKVVEAANGNLCSLKLSIAFNLKCVRIVSFAAALAAGSTDPWSRNALVVYACK